ncbi:MAG: Transcription elongation factor GreA [Brockia lithotrophica]|uniref:Transcription elongation factor GreA n=1 Tax=Brockia lithotrophica TaxID=933949 RepID=A0A2T5G517_9BACL|nr:MAG: Transcription elongation factor GreA [Brockia lithotrophica]
MADKEFFLTPEGYRKLEEELEFLKNVKRKEIAEKIKTAIGYGDLSENSEYEEAKNEQAFIEGRILELEKMLRNARIIENGGDFGVIHVGSTVLVRDLEFDEVLEFTIVGSAEADPSEHRISNESPVGRALLGRRPGEIVEVSAPAGVIRYEILEIKRDGAA